MWWRNFRYIIYFIEMSVLINKSGFDAVSRFLMFSGMKVDVEVWLCRELNLKKREIKFAI
jgi:hypothetical protein